MSIRSGLPVALELFIFIGRHPGADRGLPLAAAGGLGAVSHLPGVADAGDWV
jgi:hypothetical protein